MERGTTATALDESKGTAGTIQPDDGILPVTRWLGIFIIPFLVVAALMLYIWPNDTGITFAWAIKPPMTAMMLAAAYMGGIYFFVNVVRAKKWHTIKVGFIPVTAFAGLLGVATILHWDRFNHSHISFFAWAGLYFTAPFLVVAVYLLNRKRDVRQTGMDERILPAPIRVLIGVIGSTTLLVSLLLFISPQVMITVWPWTLTPLTARVVGAMFSLPGMVALGIAFERRWSAARIILESQTFSIMMILIAAARAWSNFDPGKISTWLFVGGLTGMLIMIGWLYVAMGTNRDQQR